MRAQKKRNEYQKKRNECKHEMNAYEMSAEREK